MPSASVPEIPIQLQLRRRLRLVAALGSDGGGDGSAGHGAPGSSPRCRTSNTMSSALQELAAHAANSGEGATLPPWCVSKLSPTAPSPPPQATVCRSCSPQTHHHGSSSNLHTHQQETNQRQQIDQMQCTNHNGDGAARHHHPLLQPLCNAATAATAQSSAKSAPPTL
ncbi:hypothetical protein OsI_29165 [Oryza sativa Indica Group]|uniref:Uncharacterized protein n=1 Tax=Oryza sativa subsp. indica TaxID=39946 RepID=B8BAJ7_ORYSI|nr:hypothetical protein OsI_29165 [Oryza sativa Indica Group]